MSADITAIGLRLTGILITFHSGIKKSAVDDATVGRSQKSLELIAAN